MVRRPGNGENAGKKGTDKNDKLSSEEGKTKRKITFREDKKESIVESELRKLKEWVHEENIRIQERI